ncbi:DHH family phosphoesterase [Candidatus Uabimicrobium sp. HlEnr_7]|uniref:DHH family phosphoesterase n=1 Tax=Candidatus Uabimicrobium helgolandensis TaxID=3095367 RepID=UPI003557F98A
MILVTHNDLDGVGCEIVARCFYPEITPDKVYHCDYGIVNETVKNILTETKEKLIVSDVSISEETAILIDEKYAKRVLLYDHHQTSEEYLKDYSWCVIDQQKSATKIIFDDSCTRKPGCKVPLHLPAFVYYVNDYDLWLHTLPYATQFNDLFGLLGKRKFVDTMLSRLRKKEALISSNDTLFLDALSVKKEWYFKNKIESAVVDGDRLLIVANLHRSDLAGYVRGLKNPPAEWKDVKYIDMVNVEKGTHSLRSYDNEFDVSKIAEQFGGGGHKNAAGYADKDFDIYSFLGLKDT